MKSKTKNLVVAALLVALGVVIPMFSLPVVPIAAMSVTLGAHVPVMLSMFVNPIVGVATALGTTLGFFLKGTDFVVVMRALSHLIFALAGSLILYRVRKCHYTGKKYWLWVIVVYIVTMVLHIAAELIVIQLITPQAVVLYTAAWVFALHHTFDFGVTLLIKQALSKAKLIS